MKHNKYRMLFAIFAICTSFYFVSCSEKDKGVVSTTDDSSQFVILTDVVPDAILEIRYFGTYNSIRISVEILTLMSIREIIRRVLLAVLSLLSSLLTVRYSVRRCFVMVSSLLIVSGGILR